MECLRSLPGLFSLSGHSSTGHDIDVRTCGNETAYISLPPPPPTSTPRVCVMKFLWDLPMWCRSDDAAIINTHYSELTSVLFLSLKMPPSPVVRHLDITSPCCPQMNPGVYTITLIFTRFVCRRNIMGWFGQRTNTKLCSIKMTAVLQVETPCVFKRHWHFLYTCLIWSDCRQTW